MIDHPVLTTTANKVMITMISSTSTQVAHRQHIRLMVPCLLFMIKLFMIKLEMLVFDKRRKPEYLGKNLSEQKHEPPLFLCLQTSKVFSSFNFWNFIHHYGEPWARMCKQIHLFSSLRYMHLTCLKLHELLTYLVLLQRKYAEEILVSPGHLHKTHWLMFDINSDTDSVQEKAA